MRQTFYRGVKEPSEAGPGQVWVEESRAGESGHHPPYGGYPGEGMTVRPLAPRDDLFECRDAFAWGGAGRPAARLAVAILADATGNDRLALALYAGFAQQFVSGWAPRWRISADSVRMWAARWANDEGLPADEEALIDAAEPAPYER